MSRAADEVECTIVTARMTLTRSCQKGWGIAFRGLTLESKVFALTATRIQSCVTIRSMVVHLVATKKIIWAKYTTHAVSLCAVCVHACVVCLL